MLNDADVGCAGLRGDGEAIALDTKKAVRGGEARIKMGEVARVVAIAEAGPGRIADEHSDPAQKDKTHTFRERPNQGGCHIWP